MKCLEISVRNWQVNLKEGQRDEKAEISGRTLAGKLKENKINELMKEQFTYMMLKDKQDKFIYLTGLTTNEFDCLYECVEPLRHLIRYPDCKGGGLEKKSTKLDIKTELVAFFHSL